MVRRKLLIIGIDGADYLLTKKFRLRYWSFLGAMDLRLMRTTIPPKTPTAWISSITGVNPGKHGVFDFFLDVDLKRKRVKYASIHDAKAKLLWEYLIENDVKVAVINFPFMYPPPKLGEGVFIGGMTVPQNAKDFAYPESLAKELLDMGYIVDIGDNVLSMLTLVRKKPIEFLRMLQKMILGRIVAVEHILRSYEVDFLFVVIVSLDRLLHWFMPEVNDLLKKEFSHLSSFEIELLKTIRLIDYAANRIYALFSRSTNSKVPVIVYSDHGFKVIRKAMLINSILLKLGLAKLGNKDNFMISQGLIANILTHLGFLNKVMRLVPVSTMKSIGWQIKPSQYFYEVFNLSEDSDVFYFSNYIWVNECKNIIFNKDRNIQINKVVLKIADILDRYGVRIIPSNYVFKGPHILRIPPFIVVTDPNNDMMTLSLIPRQSSVNVLDLSNQYEPVPSLCWRGDHTVNAVVMGRKLVIENGITIYDVMPSILRYYGIDIPKYIDGKPKIYVIRD